MRPPPLYHIPANRPFADDLVAGVRQLTQNNADDLADAIILLPNRRLATALRTAFLRGGGGRAELLPHIAPIGDIDADAAELALAGWDSADLPPAVSPLERQLLLAERLSGLTQTTHEALALAGALVDFWEQAIVAECTMSDLSGLVEEADLAEHWQQILAVLDLLLEWWPEKLKNLGKSDPSLWRDAAIRARAEAWRVAPPQGLVVIAGSTGSLPSTRALMQTVLTLPRGRVVLPGLDTGMSQEEWAALSDGSDETAVCHPQYTLARLLKHLGVEPRGVGLWPGSPTPNDGGADNGGDDNGGADDASSRLALLREVFRPAHETGTWQTIPMRGVVSGDSLNGFSIAQCYDQRLEAQSIALAMREALEEAGRTAALVTESRTLARMVSSELAKWNLTVEDSAGKPLADTPPAQFLRLLAQAWVNDFAPIDLLALLQHHCASGGAEKSQFRKNIRGIDRYLLRGSQCEGGLSGLMKRANKEQKLFLQNHIIAPLKPLLEYPQDGTRSLPSLIDALSEAAENLAATPTDPLALWQEQDGIRVARMVQNLTSHTGNMTIEPSELLAVITLLLGGEVIYPSTPSHPRLAIMGGVEGRMHTADLIILGGMNEGIAPAHPSGDPWMSNAMRLAFGLPPANWRVAHEAHDAFMMMSQSEVLISYSTRIDNTPAEPSRWLRRLQSVLQTAHLDMPTTTQYQRLAQAMTMARGAIKPIRPPAPTLKANERPRVFSATDLDLLNKDPYSLYAKKVLRLKPLDAVDEPLTVAERGKFIHEALDAFTKGIAPSDKLPDDALVQLLALGEALLEKLPPSPWVEVFWRAQFEAIAHWFIAIEQKRDATIAARHAEITGAMAIEGLTDSYTVNARADRINLLYDGSVEVIDYKTGTVPSKTAVSECRALQLVVEAALARRGHFDGIDATQNIALEYWKLSGRINNAGTIESRTAEMNSIEAEKIITDLLHRFDCDEAQYISESLAQADHTHSPYRHLARVQEWRSHDDEGEG